MNKKWTIVNELNNDEAKIESIIKKHNVSHLVAEILASKEITNDKDIDIFLNPTRHCFHDPFEMPDMRKAVDRIIEAIDKKQKILVYGDYDVDGITSITIFKRFMKDRNVDVGVYIPNRIDEGYGLNKNAIDTIAKEGYNLIITVDCGITSIDEVEYAKQKNIDIIITDHHEPGEDIPNAVAVVDCKRKDSKYKFRELAGCGVSFKLTQALSQELKINENENLKYLDIACLGTISDIVPLVDENRVISKLGLLLLNQTKNVGLRELLKVTKYKKVNSTAVSFGLSPRINACGRMGHQEVALKLLLTDDPIEARELTEKLEGYNRERQQTEKKIYDEAISLIDKDSTDKAIVIGKENWHHGVIGIVSSKITEKYYKPSILVCFEGENSKGSGRSIKGFDLHDALEKNSEYLSAFGGHSMAIGLSLKTENFENFQKQFVEFANKNITEEMAQAKLSIDYELQADDINVDTIKSLNLLEPFGEANQNPLFIIKNLKITSIRTLSEGKHLKLNMQIGNTYLDAIGFNMGELAADYKIGNKIDIVGNAEINNFNDTEIVQIILKDLRKSIL